MLNHHVFRFPLNFNHVPIPEPKTKTPTTHSSGEFSSLTQRVATLLKNVFRFRQMRLSFCGSNFVIWENSHSTAHSVHTFTCCINTTNWSSNTCTGRTCVMLTWVTRHVLSNHNSCLDGNCSRKRMYPHNKS